LTNFGEIWEFKIFAEIWEIDNFGEIGEYAIYIIGLGDGRLCAKEESDANGLSYLIVLLNGSYYYYRGRIWPLK